MNIVVLDGYALNPGDLSWEGFRAAGNLTVYDRTENDKIIERSGNAEILITNKVSMGEDFFSNLPLLKYVGVLATGYNIIDIGAAREHGITITNIPAYGTDSVAQMTFALLLELCHNVQRHSDSVMAGKWSASIDFCYWDYPLIELAGKTIGIIGFGNIGKKVADIASSFGMNILAYDIKQTSQPESNNFKWAELSEIWSGSDVISIHSPLLPETKGLINKETLVRMKKTAYLINTSRGPIVVEADLADALNRDIIAGAGLDVLSIEPPSNDNPLFKAKNCIITPHIAWATKAARERLMSIAVNNLLEFLAGRPVNVVNK